MIVYKYLSELSILTDANEQNSVYYLTALNK